MGTRSTAGRADGGSLREQSAGVPAPVWASDSTTDVPLKVGMLFSPSWAKISVLISEVTTRLPTWAMHKYADAVLAELAPSRSAGFPSRNYWD